MIGFYLHLVREVANLVDNGLHFWHLCKNTCKWSHPLAQRTGILNPWFLRAVSPIPHYVIALLLQCSALSGFVSDSLY
jgi:hypothetical protein